MYGPNIARKKFLDVQTFTSYWEIKRNERSQPPYDIDAEGTHSHVHILAPPRDFVAKPIAGLEIQGFRL